MKRISMATRDELLKAVASRYRYAARAENARIVAPVVEPSISAPTV